MYKFRKDLEAKQKNEVDVPHQKTMLCLNESPYNPMDIIQHTFYEKLKSININRYFSDVTEELYLKLANYVGASFSKENILFGNGADEMLYYLFVATRENSDSYILSLSPSYFDYKSYSGSVGMNIKSINLDDDYSFDSQKILELAQAENCKLIILCNPNNPTGNLLEEKKIIEIIKNTEKLVLIDEAYFEFSGKTFVDRIHEFDNLIILRSFSKGFSSAGLRFGYLVSQKKNISEIKKVFTVFNSSILIQTFALSILEHQDEFLQLNKLLINERNELYKKMIEIEEVTAIKSFTNFISFTLGELSIDFFDYLKKRDIAIRNIGKHPILKNYLRISLGSPEQNKLFFKQLENYIKHIKEKK